MNTDIIRSTVKALIFTICAAVVFLLIANAVVLRAEDPNSISGILGTAVLITSAVVGGIVAARTSYEKLPITCLCFTTIYLLIHLAAQLTAGGGQGSFLKTFLSYAGCYAASLLACLLTRPKQTKSTKGIRKFKKYSKRMRG